MFLLYINDISSKGRDVNIYLYADDLNLYASGFQLCDVQDKLQGNINYIMEWCKVNNMSLNPSESTCMTIASSYKLMSLSPLQLKVNSQPLSNVFIQEILGVYVDNKLNWHAQIDSVCRKLNTKIALLKNMIY